MIISYKIYSPITVEQSSQIVRNFPELKLAQKQQEGI